MSQQYYVYDWYRVRWYDKGLKFEAHSHYAASDHSTKPKHLVRPAVCGDSLRHGFDKRMWIFGDIEIDKGGSKCPQCEQIKLQMDNQHNKEPHA